MNKNTLETSVNNRPVNSSSDIAITVSIQQLNQGDSYALINNAIALNAPRSDSDDLGFLFDLLEGTIVNDLLDQAAITTVSIKFNSNYDLNVGTNSIDVDTDQVNNFISSLVGRPITIYSNYYSSKTKKSSTKIEFQGYIVDSPESVTVHGGQIINLQCKTLLAQLGKMTSNGNYETATQKYGNIFSTISANQVNLSQLLKVIKQGTLIQSYHIADNSYDNASINIIDGTSPALPQNLWATILPDNNRLDTLKELFIIYSRIIYQNAEGAIIIQPLFTDDDADDVYTVNYLSNYGDNNWIFVEGESNAIELPNRFDVTFGVTVPIPLFGSPFVDPTIFCSAPKISNNQIVSNNISGLDYTEVYKTSTRLYNSGFFIMPQQRNIQLDNSIVLNDQLINAIFSIYNTNNLSNSIIYNSSNPKNNTIPQIYAQLYLAQINFSNYVATVLYDYLKVIDALPPLGKIVTINNFNKIDYPQMLVFRTTLRFNPDQGTTYKINTCPLLSITGIWSTLNAG